MTQIDLELKSMAKSALREYISSIRIATASALNARCSLSI